MIASTEGKRSRTARKRSIPFIFGILISVMRISGSASSIRESASNPSEAVAITRAP